MKKKTLDLKLLTCKEEWESLKGNYTHFIYLFIGEDKRVLYIGKTVDVEKRWGEHCRTSKFDISKVVEVEVIAYRSPSETAFAELQGILYYDPPWNTYPLKGYMSDYKIPYITRCLFTVDGVSANDSE